MHDAVADGDGRPAQMLHQPAAQHGLAFLHRVGGLGLHRLVHQHTVFRVHGMEARRRAADAAHLPLEAAVQALVLAQLIELELDRGTAGVQDEDRLAHAEAPPAVAGFAARARA